MYEDYDIYIKIIQFLDLSNLTIMLAGTVLINIQESQKKQSYCRIFSWIVLLFQIVRVIVTILLLQNKMSRMFLLILSSFESNDLLQPTLTVFLLIWHNHWQYQLIYVLLEPVLVIYLIIKINSNINRIADHYLNYNKHK